MPLTGEYEPSTLDWARKNAEEIMASGGTQGMEMRGMPVILLTTIGVRALDFLPQDDFVGRAE